MDNRLHDDTPETIIQALNASACDIAAGRVHDALSVHIELLRLVDAQDSGHTLDAAGAARKTRRRARSS